MYKITTDGIVFANGMDLKEANATLAQARRDSIKRATDLESEATEARDFARSLIIEKDA